MMMMIGMITFRKLIMLSYLLTKVNALPAHAFGRLQSQTQEELDAL